MFRKNKKTAELEKDNTISTTPVVSDVSITRVKNPVEIDVPDDYNPANKFGVDDRLLVYFYTKKEIDEMDFGWEIPDKPVPNLDAILLRLDALEKHTHNYDGDIIENDLPF